jgi:hypothetical protein
VVQLPTKTVKLNQKMNSVHDGFDEEGLESLKKEEELRRI